MKPAILVIFGFTGDLVGRHFLPALYHLEAAGVLPDKMAILGITRRRLTLAAVREQLASRLHDRHETIDEKVIERFFSRLELVDADITRPEDYQKLNQVVARFEQLLCSNRLLYFAVPPQLLETVLGHVVASGLHHCGNGVSARLLIEKPFGTDSASAIRLLELIRQHFGPDHLFPIDHYLAKETVQNILYFRFHNPMIRAVWNPQHLKQIQISALENIDIQGRANFYEQTGALRDMIQSHLLQLAGLATMEEPATLDAAGIRQARQTALELFDRLPSDLSHSVVRGQYRGYQQEVGNGQSSTETFAAVRFTINREGWRKVPVYLRAGKALESKKTEITLIYDDPTTSTHDDNVLTIRIQPNEGIALRLTAKKPGLANATHPIVLDYCYDQNTKPLNEAYEKILYDALRGDQTLFQTDREIINNWQLVEPILTAWQESKEMEIYEKGASSIAAADALLARDGNQWVELANICHLSTRYADMRS